MVNKLLISETQKILKDLKQYKGKKIGFVISTTSKLSTEEAIFLPIRLTNHGVFGAVTVYDVNTAKEIAKYLDKKIDFMLVDAENKLKKIVNLYEEITKVVTTTPIFSFKNNDMTCNTADSLIALLLGNKTRKKISIIGLGNIGTKLSLKLVERGYDVFIASSDFRRTKKISNALNLIKFRYCKSKIRPSSIESVSKNSDLLVGFSSGKPKITSKIVKQMKNNSIIIDGGIGNITEDGIKESKRKSIEIYRLDVRPGFFSEVSLIFENKKFLDSIRGKKTLQGIDIVAGGYYGEFGDIVVDNIKNPKSVIGISDGFGGLIRNNFTKQMINDKNTIKRTIKKSKITPST